jgi:hypothetical protein
VVNSQRDQDRPLEEDRWQRLRDLVNSEVRKVRAQELGALSREWRNHEERRQSLDLVRGRTVGSEPHSCVSCIRRFGG